MTSVSSTGGSPYGVYPADSYYGVYGGDGLGGPLGPGSTGDPYALPGDLYSPSNPYALQPGGTPQGQSHGSFLGALFKSVGGFLVGGTVGFIKDTLWGMTHNEKGEFSLWQTIKSAATVGLGALAVWATGGLAAIPLGLYGMYKFGGQALDAGSKWGQAMMSGHYDHAVAESYNLGKAATGLGLSFYGVRAGVAAAAEAEAGIAAATGETAATVPSGIYGTLRAGVGQMFNRGYWGRMASNAGENLGPYFQNTANLFRGTATAAEEVAGAEGAVASEAAATGEVVAGAEGSVTPCVPTPGGGPAPTGAPAAPSVVDRVTGATRPYVDAARPYYDVVRNNGVLGTARTVGGDAWSAFRGNLFPAVRSYPAATALVTGLYEDEDPQLNLMNPFRGYFNPDAYRYHGVPGEEDYIHRYGGMPPYMSLPPGGGFSGGFAGGMPY